MHICDNKETILSFKSFQAKLLNHKRKFHLAAWEYYRLSNLAEDEKDRTTMLTGALTCAILSPASDNKARLMATLHKDERSQNILP